MSGGWKYIWLTFVCSVVAPHYGASFLYIYGGVDPQSWPHLADKISDNGILPVIFSLLQEIPYGAFAVASFFPFSVAAGLAALLIILVWLSSGHVLSLVFVVFVGGISGVAGSLAFYLLASILYDAYSASSFAFSSIFLTAMIGGLTGAFLWPFRRWVGLSWIGGYDPIRPFSSLRLLPRILRVGFWIILMPLFLLFSYSVLLGMHVFANMLWANA